MTKQERESKVRRAGELAREIKKLLNDVVWEPQEGQRDHFDNLTKVEKVALVGLYSDACNTVESIAQYESWFINE